MKIQYLIIIFLISSCSSFENNQFDGIWRLVRACPNGELIKTSSIYQISNDSLIQINPDNIRTSITLMRLTKDSITIYDDCGIQRLKYEFKNSGVIDLLESDWQFERINKDSLSQQDLFDQFQVQLELPTNDLSNKIIPNNPYPIFIGYHKYENIFNCGFDKNEVSEFTLEDDITSSDTITSPFEIGKDFVIRYSGISVSTKELREIKSVLPFNVAENERVSLLIYADKQVSDSTINNFKLLFKSAKIDVYQIVTTDNDKLNFNYIKL